MNPTRVLVTVGTTPFRTLVNYFDIQSSSLHIRIQCGEEPYTKHVDSFKFTDDLQEEINQAELVVTHAGAGTVYSLLEQGKPTLVIPNLERQDRHQAELAKHIELESYAMTETCLEKWARPHELVLAAIQFKRAKYKKEAFFQAELLREIIREREPLSFRS